MDYSNSQFHFNSNYYYCCCYYCYYYFHYFLIIISLQKIIYLFRQFEELMIIIDNYLKLTIRFIILISLIILNITINLSIILIKFLLISQSHHWLIIQINVIMKKKKCFVMAIYQTQMNYLYQPINLNFKVKFIRIFRIVIIIIVVHLKNDLTFMVMMLMEIVVKKEINLLIFKSYKVVNFFEIDTMVIVIIINFHSLQRAS